MSDVIYVPAKPEEPIRMHGGQPDWPLEGRPVNFTIPYEARLVAEGTLIKKKAPENGGQKAGDK